MTGGRFPCLVLLVFLAVKSTDNAAVDVFKKTFAKTTDEVVGLYSIKDDVEILTTHNFKSQVFGSKRVWLVEFYNSYCGFCQRFAPSWKTFATDVKEWKDLVAVAALDCSNEENNQLCRDFEIMGYPTLRYFHEDYVEGPQNFGLVVKAGSSPVEHTEKLLEIFGSEQWQSRGKYLPNLLPYVEVSHDTLLTDLHAQPTIKYVVLIIQEPTSIVGQQLVLDLHKMTNIIVKYAFNNNTELLANLNIKDAPSVLVIDQSNFIKELNIDVDPKKTVVDFLAANNIVLHDEQDVQDKNLASNNLPEEENSLSLRVKQMGDVVFQKDLETALRYSLRKEVARTKEITGEKLEALKKYINVQIKYFPFGKYGHAFLMDLKHFIDGSGDVVLGRDVYKKVKEAEKEDSQVFSSPDGWVACQGSNKMFRGYPCGLWKMFHYLTVNHADHNADNKTANAREVLDAMHAYIKNFFGCTDCSSHFQDMAKRREIEKVDDLSQSVLWLWEAHNEVNKRLSGDATEDPKFPKVQFPTEKGCPQCYLNDKSWDRAEVLKYMKHVYGSINVRYIGSDTRILHMGLEGGAAGSGSMFPAIDTRILCFLTMGLAAAFY